MRYVPTPHTVTALAPASHQPPASHASHAVAFDDDWNVPRRITTIALNDDVDEPTEIRTIYHTTSGCEGYNHNNDDNRNENNS